MRYHRIFVGIMLLVLLLPLYSNSQGFKRQRQLKDVQEARGLAANNTLLPLVTGIGAAYLFENTTVRKIGATLAIYGLMMGPSAGNFYAEDYLRGGLGVITRAGSGYLMIDATRELMGDKIADPLGWDDTSISLTDTKILIGAGVFIGSIVYNVISANASVNEYNRNLGYSFSIMPQNVNNEIVPLLTTRISF